MDPISNFEIQENTFEIARLWGDETFEIARFWVLFNINIIEYPIFISISWYFIWIGNPKPHLRRFRLAAGVVFLGMPFGKKAVFW